MSCTASTLTYSCGHKYTFPVSCHCGLGRQCCDASQSRIILRAKFVRLCPRDIKRHARQAFDQLALQQARFDSEIPGVEEHQDIETPTDRSPEYDYWRQQCWELSDRRYTQIWKVRKRKIAAMAEESEMALTWTRSTSKVVHCVMFCSKTKDHAGEKSLRKRWTRKPAGVTVIESGMLSQAELRQIQEGQNGLKPEGEADAVIEAARSSKPAVPRFPRTRRVPRTPERQIVQKRSRLPDAPRKPLPY
ncbi:hypothetical protein LIA77_02386 [Sarocladium implicatum]|nr:hypothetical protein LIA77_02386 [Sarocladium implicatum]